MSNIALQIERTFSGSVAGGSNVIFNSVVYSAGNISYNNLTGVITFNEAGRYVFNWFIVTQSTLAPAIVFAVSTSQGDFLQGNSPIKTGEIGGACIVDVSAPMTASLVNATTNTVFFSTITPLIASMVIIQDDIVTV